MKNKKHLLILIILVFSNLAISKSYSQFRRKLERRTKQFQKIEYTTYRETRSQKLSKNSRRTNMAIHRLDEKLTKKAIQFIDNRLTIENFNLIANSQEPLPTLINFIEQETRQNNIPGELYNIIILVTQRLFDKKNTYLLEIGALKLSRKIGWLEYEWKKSQYH